ncbi:LamB/YcsF family protein, partial [Paracoccus liaowanqingii]
AGLRLVAEAFADRAYTAAGALVSRRQPGAVLHDPDLVAARMVRLATEGVIEAQDGSTLTLQVDSFCVHGDSPGAVAMAAAVRRALSDRGVTVASFAP